jgi:hypothetical protein
MKWFKTLRQSKVFRWLVQPLLILVPLLLLGRYYVSNWEALRAYEWRLDLPMAGLGLLLLLMAFALLPLAFQQILAGLGRPIGYLQAYHGFYISQLAKYLPGRVWVVPGRALALKPYGIDAVSSSFGMLIESFVLAITGVIVFVPYALLSPNGTFSWLWYLSPLLLFLLHPRVFNTALRWLQTRLGNEKSSVDLSNRQSLSIIALGLLFWVVTGVGFTALVASVRSIPGDFLWILPGAFSFSWAVGSLVFVSPGGLGAREGALVLMLSPVLATPIPAIVALLSRLWWTIGDLLSWLIAFVGQKVWSNDEPPDSESTN